jgi:SAM-dependent methyltransferase
MRIPWLRRNFLARRWLDRIFLDVPDAVLRSLRGRSHWPPLSLRAFVGHASGFEDVGRWFVDDLKELGLVGPGTRVLEIGCGCGRLAQPLAADETLRKSRLAYTGMDIDGASIEWCSRNIRRMNSRFDFYHADCHNASYNPAGSIAAASYHFPHPDASFDLILLTSVFTHVLPDELGHYLSEIARLLAPDGVAYASFFLFGSQTESDRAGRHPIEFSFSHQDYAVNREDFPANAVAFREDFVREILDQAGLAALGPPRYGPQDLLLITRVAPAESVGLLSGWHELESERWRWTERVFNVSLPRPPADAATLRFRFTIAEAVLKETGIVRLRAAVNGVALETREFTTTGESIYVQRIPPAVLQASERPLIRFELENACTSAGPDRRELGVQVVFWTHCNETLRALQLVTITTAR